MTLLQGGHITLKAIRGLQLKDDSTFFFFFITLGLELSDTKVYEP